VVGFLPVPVDLIRLLPKSWHEFVDLDLLAQISKNLTSSFIPEHQSIFRALQIPPDQVKVVIVGQDPYPNPKHAMGLAFSIPAGVAPLPKSLKNIFTELNNDLAIDRSNGDLSDWANQGVLLLNRSLTVESGKSDSHSNIGWQDFTEKIIQAAANNGALAILWGNEAQKLSNLFAATDVFKSAHPSPLSAYRGFFGSTPFSKVNKRLIEKGLIPIKW
jgi:uracil-DNA glycosylase